MVTYEQLQKLFEISTEYFELGYNITKFYDNPLLEQRVFKITFTKSGELNILVSIEESGQHTIQSFETIEPKDIKTADEIIFQLQTGIWTKEEIDEWMNLKYCKKNNSQK